LTAVRRKRISMADADGFLRSLSDLRIHLADPLSYDGVFELADRHGLTVYDAAYLDLVLREGLPLASLDTALIRAAAQSGATIFQP
jgi:predicted nucleic acid-binding protein